MVFTVFALLFAFYLTFHEWSALEPETPFVGLRNYSDMVADESFRAAIVNTFYFTAVSVPFTMAIGLLIALLLNLPLRARGAPADALLPARGHPVRGRRDHLEVDLQR